MTEPDDRTDKSGPIPDGHYRRRSIDWTAISAITSAIALVLVAGSLFYSAVQIRTTRQVAQSQFLLDHYSLAQEFNDEQKRLVDGDWSTPGAGPSTSEEWFRVARYMGLMEQIEIFIETSVMDVEVADSRYSHRIFALYQNGAIRGRLLEGEAYRWEYFLKLIERLKEMPVFSGLLLAKPL